ncbi:MAG TPA: DUF4129 domain-containing protein [Longimicrobiaceae bacterium]|nr:DUF4129 domain-containing protein [Longimicrobiaceae bacterium]
MARALQKVYARPEFAPERTDGWLHRLYTWWEGVKDAWWAWVWKLQVLQHTAPVVFWILIGWLAVAAIGIAVHLVYTFAQGWRTREAALAAAASGSPGTPRARTADDWDEEARRAAAEGRLRDASIATYQALLLRLDARGVVRFDPAKTPGDYRREARKHAAAGPAMGGFLRQFEPVAFGGRPVDGGSYERLRAAAEAAARV